VLDFSPRYIYISTEGFLKLNVLESTRRYSRAYEERRLYPSLLSPE
jgi:hypothetical protein